MGSYVLRRADGMEERNECGRNAHSTSRGGVERGTGWQCDSCPGAGPGDGQISDMDLGKGQVTYVWWDLTYSSILSGAAICAQYM